MITLGTWFAVGLLTVWPVATERAPTYFSLATHTAAVEPAPDPSAGPPTGFTVTDAIQVPGRTLSAGAYTIRVMGQLSDRMIVRVERKGKAQSTFLALPKSGLNGSAGPIRLPGAGGKSAMRGFVFPDGTVAEFVYPKGEAVGLAKANGTTIPAIDPVSDGRKDSPNLSNDDLQMVTLWLLSPTPVGPGETGAGIKAARYQAPPAAATSAPAEVSSAQVPPRPPAARKPHPKPVMAVLPHTAGEMPLVEMAGLLSLCAAGWLRRRRMAR